jgi:hypothetical protein
VLSNPKEETLSYPMWGKASRYLRGIPEMREVG